MNAMRPRLSVNATLGLMLAALGFFAVFAGDPYASATVTIDTTELAEMVQREVDHVSPEELADWIIQGKADYRVIDLRTPQEFAKYHVPGAENVPITTLADHGLVRNEKIVLYSEGGIHSAQAWFLLQARGYRGSYILRGGLEEWKDRVLFPVLAENASSEEKAHFEKMKQVSAFFGGQPRTGGGPEPPAVSRTMPTIEMPAASAGAPVRAPTKKRKEGC